MSEEPQYLTIDHFEAGMAVLETVTGASLVIPSAWLPAEVAEGDALLLDVKSVAAERSTLEFRVDPEGTERLRAQARRLREALPEGPEGDIDL